MLVISGGQTGADEGGLEGARLAGVSTGGMAPKGYLTEKGPNLKLKTVYGLEEHSSPSYPPRTQVNATASDGTVWFGKTTSPGYWCTKKAAKDKPWLENPDTAALRVWMMEHGITVLNVAGNRESTNPGIYGRAKQTIYEALR